MPLFLLMDGFHDGLRDVLPVPKQGRRGYRNTFRYVPLCDASNQSLVNFLALRAGTG
jgi:hypothetical protein